MRFSVGEQSDGGVKVRGGGKVHPDLLVGILRFKDGGSASLSEVDMCASSSRTPSSWSMVVLRSAMTSLCAPSSDCVGGSK